MTQSARAADFILETRPPVVVVETAVDEEHGAVTGSSISSTVFSQMESNGLRGLRNVTHMIFTEAGSTDVAGWVSFSSPARSQLCTASTCAYPMYCTAAIRASDAETSKRRPRSLTAESPPPTVTSL